MLVHEQRGDKGYENLIKKDSKVARQCCSGDFLMFMTLCIVKCRLILFYMMSHGEHAMFLVFPGVSGGRSGVRECSLGRGRRKLQETGKDSVRGCPPYHCLHLLPGILHQMLQAPAYGQHLEALPQSTEGGWP